MYRFSSTTKTKNASAIWKFIQNGLSNDVIIKSIKEKRPYTVNYVNKHEISFSASTRNNGEAEIISFTDFKLVIENLATLTMFNTNLAKDCFKGTKMYKKRSPFFALLLSCGVIEKISLSKR